MISTLKITLSNKVSKSHVASAQVGPVSWRLVKYLSNYGT